MKDLKEELFGDDYADRLKRTTTKFEKIKTDYKGDFDVKNERMITMSYNGKAIPILTIDENVPMELREKFNEGFNSIWS
jgi:hypothetical protein